MMKFIKMLRFRSHSKIYNLVATIGFLGIITAFCNIPAPAASGTSDAPQATPKSRVLLPLLLSSGPTAPGANPTQTATPGPVPTLPPPVSEWNQDAHDPQRTGYTPEDPKEPWTLLWTWNGPDSQGGTGNHFYNAPKDARTVIGGNHIYVPAGKTGLFALVLATGSPAWHLTNTGFNATPAYDPSTGDLYAGGTNGLFYKIDAASGKVLKTYQAGSPLNESMLLVGKYAYLVTDNGELHKVDINTMTRVWKYTSGSTAATPPSYSASKNVIVFCTDDLYVHAVNNADGSQRWRVKPTPHNAVFPYTFEGYWPVIADKHGIVFVRMNLGFDALWSGTLQGSTGGGVYPTTNQAIRQLLEANGGSLKNLFALSLDDGSESFVPAVGYGGVEDLLNGQPVLVTGPVPVIKLLPNGNEVAYSPFRNGQGNPPDGRWDSHMGEMVLDNSTVPGLVAGDMRFVQFDNSYTNITDEQTPLSAAGNSLFVAHWGASESVQIVDRSNNLGLNFNKPITSQPNHPVIRRIQSCSNFNPTTHWTTCGLALMGDNRYWDGPGWWVYWNVLDPPTPARSSYSEGILPRYTYVSNGLVIVEGNGGDLFVLRHSGN